MIEDYHEIGLPISFGQIVIQCCAMPRRMIRELPRGEPKYLFKLGYKIIKCAEYTPIEDFYNFIKWQLEFEKQVRFLDDVGEIVDTKPNSVWKEKHLEPLEKILKSDEKKTLSVVEDDDFLPEYWPFDNKEQYLKWL